MLLADVPKDVDEETSALLDKVKSPDAAVRVEAVREFIGIREAVADELTKIVSDADEGRPTSNSAARLSAMYLMGEWGLLQCRDVIQAHVGKLGKPVWPDGAPVTMIRGHMREKSNGVQFFLGRLGLAQGVTLNAARPKASLDSYPALRTALMGLRALDYETFTNAENEVYWWHRCVEDSLERIPLTKDYQGKYLYSDEVKVTAVFLAGEYRAHDENTFLTHIDLRDEKGIIGGYPSSLTAQTTDSEYPAAVALVKCGQRPSMEWCFRAVAEGRCSPEGSQRLARTLVIIDPVRAKSALDRLYNDVQTLSGQRTDTAERLSRLSAVKGIVK